MSFDTDVDINDIVIEENPYLADEKQGLSLVSSLLGGTSKRSHKEINNILDTIIAACDRLHLEDGEFVFGKLRQLVELLKTPARNNLLKGCTIVGFGGQFSSGKSAVLNSLLDSGANVALPENTLVATSVSTYLLFGQKEMVTACTKNGNEVNFDAHALEAVSHDFNRKYGFNPAQYIDFISINLPQLGVNGIALLDTPGYNASDIATLQDHTDKIRSQTALSSVDHLVWLISAKEPLLNKTDADFIKSLNPSHEVTVLVNKCDTVSDIYTADHPESSEPMQIIREGFKDADINCGIIIPYCAREPEWNNGRKKMFDFLRKASASQKHAEDRQAQLAELLSKIDKEFQTTIATLSVSQMEKIDNHIDETMNPFELQSVVKLRGLLGFEHANLLNDYSIFKACSEKITHWVKRQLSEQ